MSFGIQTVVRAVFQLDFPFNTVNYDFCWTGDDDDSYIISPTSVCAVCRCVWGTTLIDAVVRAEKSFQSPEMPLGSRVCECAPGERHLVVYVRLLYRLLFLPTFVLLE